MPAAPALEHIVKQFEIALRLRINGDKVFTGIRLRRFEMRQEGSLCFFHVRAARRPRARNGI